MATRGRCDSARIAESECRRQQLEAYLQRKGKLKIPGPNDRYYLGDKTNRKLQRQTAAFKAALGENQKCDARTKPSKLNSVKNPTCMNHFKSVASRNQVQSDSKTTLTKQVMTVLFTVDSNTEKESVTDPMAQSRQCVGDLLPEASASGEFNHNSRDQEKENKLTVGTAQIVGQSTNSALMKQFTLRSNNIQDSKLKNTASDNQSWAIGTDNIARAAPGAARPVGAPRAAPGAARPVGAPRAAPGAARPVGAPRAAPGAARPVGAPRAAPGAARPVGAPRAAPGAARPVGAPRAAPGAARPVGAPRAAPGAARPVGAPRAAPGAARPVDAPRAAPGAARPVGVPKPVGAPRVVKTTSAAAKSTGMVTIPKEKTEKICGKLSKREQELARVKAGKSSNSASIQNGSNSATSRPVTIWKPFARSAQKLHLTLESPTRNIKSKGALQNISGSTKTVMSTVKRQDVKSSIIKTLRGKDERRKQLEEWLTSKGKTYKRPPMPTPFKKVIKSVKKNLEHSFLEVMEREEQKDLADGVQDMLDDCMKLLERGSSPKHIYEALKNVPEGEKFAKYWICQARLLELTGTMEAVIALFEKAVHSGAQPVEELRSALVETIMRNANSHTACTEKEDTKTESFEETAVVTPCTKVRLLCGKTDERGSSVIKYRITATPQVLRMNESMRRIRSTGQQDLKFLTPVRRSVRIEQVSASHPEMLREHDCCVTSLNELLDEEEAETFVYRENQALLGE
ncbi:cytoskeleton-associated protein 2-like [Hypanus sabinus]|uniref:cytoskeleton-associated protein 2-like n=1 Tax=Hypanus sabinus TaxID=79690 RepID=UPI0028C4C15C|nr:cytoskeleton-associated protein 2-like [Hypanus sabinus]